MKHFAIGQRVRLAADGEGNPVETGRVLGGPNNGVYLVEVDAKFRDARDDDGLREVPVADVSDEWSTWERIGRYDLWLRIHDGRIVVSNSAGDWASIKQHKSLFALDTVTGQHSHSTRADVIIDKLLDWFE